MKEIKKTFVEEKLELNWENTWKTNKWLKPSKENKKSIENDRIEWKRFFAIYWDFLEFF